MSERKLNSSAELLMDATATLLSERGVTDVSLSDIAKRSGLNSALIKYYFGNKDGLLLALLERDARKAMGSLEHLLAMPISAEQKLKIHISGIINAYFRSPYLNRLIHFMSENSDRGSSSRVVEIYINPIIAAYHSIVKQGVEEGRFSDVNPTFLYFSLVGACDLIFHATYSLPSVFGTEKISEEIKQQYIAHVTEVFLSGILLGK